MENQKNSVPVGTFEAAKLSDTKPVAAPMITIEVEISLAVLVGQYVKAFVRKTRNANSYLAEQHPINAQDLKRYIAFLVKTRIDIVSEAFTMPIHKLSPLWIPVYVQWALSNIGRCVIRERGITLVPVFSEKQVSESGDSEVIKPMTYAEAIQFSTETLDLWSSEIAMVQKAMPKDIGGDVDVMSCALIENKVRGLHSGIIPARTYVSAFLGMKIRKENAFGVLYRTEYADIAFLEEVFGSLESLVP